VEGTPLRVLIVDDERGVRDGLSLRLGTEPDLQVVGTAPDGWTGLGLALGLRPDVVLVDGRMPDLDGFALCRRLRDAGVPVVMLSLFDDAASRSEAAAAGARAFVSKCDGDAALLAAVRGTRPV
jgi:DNA-binding NarL/FixJ family response regulator